MWQVNAAAVPVLAASRCVNTRDGADGELRADGSAQPCRCAAGGQASPSAWQTPLPRSRTSVRKS